MKILLATCFVLISSSIAVGQNSEIYVSDAGNFNVPPWKILKFDENGNNPEIFINQNLSWPQDILFLDGTNTVLISNLRSGKITRYNAKTGDYIDNFAEGIGGPTRMKIGADNLLYVLQWDGNGKVLRYNLNGTLMGALRILVFQTALVWTGTAAAIYMYPRSVTNRFGSLIAVEKTWAFSSAPICKVQRISGLITAGIC